MDKLIYKINKKEYLLLERLITSDNEYRLARIEDKLNKLGIIQQGIKEISSGGFFTSGHAIIKLLVPVKKLIQFENLWEGNT